MNLFTFQGDQLTESVFCFTVAPTDGILFESFYSFFEKSHFFTNITNICFIFQALHQKILDSDFIIVRCKDLAWERQDSEKFYAEHSGVHTAGARPDFLKWAKASCSLSMWPKVSQQPELAVCKNKWIILHFAAKMPTLKLPCSDSEKRAKQWTRMILFCFHFQADSSIKDLLNLCQGRPPCL